MTRVMHLRTGRGDAEARSEPRNAPKFTKNKPQSFLFFIVFVRFVAFVVFVVAVILYFSPRLCVSAAT
jgi:hypothetical protein